MKALLIGDCHLADVAPSIRTEAYTEEILGKLSWCVDKANELGVDALIQGGDMFHVKAASRTSHALVQATADVLTKAEMPVLIVPGNHDLQHDRLESLKKQPLGTLVKVSGIDLLMGPHPEFPVFGIPYLQDWVAQLPGWMRRYREWAASQLNPLLVTHAPIFAGEEPPFDFIAAEDWAELMGGEGTVFSGHIHEAHGAYKVGGVWFANLGALSRGSLHEKTLKRVPRVTIWDSERSGGSSRTAPQVFPEVIV